MQPRYARRKRASKRLQFSVQRWLQLEALAAHIDTMPEIPFILDVSFVQIRIGCRRHALGTLSALEKLQRIQPARVWYDGALERNEYVSKIAVTSYVWTPRHDKRQL